MDLFKMIKPNMFSVLSSKNREIYVSALFVIRNSFMQEYSIEKNKLQAQLINVLEKNLLSMDLESEEKPKDFKPDDIRSLANLVIRKLDETGWIEIDFSRTGKLSEIIIIPPYSIKIINVLYEIEKDQQSGYTTYLYNICSTTLS